MSLFEQIIMTQVYLTAFGIMFLQGKPVEWITTLVGFLVLIIPIQAIVWVWLQ